jgi:hypothetical protein
MAKIRNDIPLRALSGAAGQGLEARMNAAGRPIVVISLTEMEKPLLAKAKARAVVTESRTLEGIQHKVEGVLRPEYMVQTLDLFRGDEIRDVDASDWHGDVGQVIRLHASESKQVTVVISDGNGLVIEQGPATRSEGDLWTYMTMATATDGPHVIVTTRELPPHLVEVLFQ